MPRGLKIKSFDPTETSYASRITKAKWNRFEPLLRRLHKEDLRRVQMLPILDQHGFKPSIGQLNAQMKKWGLNRYGVVDVGDNDVDASSVTTGAATETSCDMHDLAGMDPGLETISVLSPSSESFIDFESEPALTPPSPGNDTTTDWVELFKCHVAALKTHWDVHFWFYHTELAHLLKYGQDIGDSDIQAIINIADFFRAHESWATAQALNIMLLAHLAETIDLTDLRMAQCLVRCGLSIIELSDAVVLEPVFEAALQHYDSRQMEGARACMETITAQTTPIFHICNDNCNSSCPRRQLALFLVGNSPLKMYKFDAAVERANVLDAMRICEARNEVIAHLEQECIQSLASISDEFFENVSHCGHFLKLSIPVTEKCTRKTSTCECVASTNSFEILQSTATCPFQNVFVPAISCHLIVRAVLNRMVAQIIQQEVQREAVLQAFKQFTTPDPVQRCERLLDQFLTQFSLCQLPRESTLEFNGSPLVFSLLSEAHKALLLRLRYPCGDGTQYLRNEMLLTNTPPGGLSTEGPSALLGFHCLGGLISVASHRKKASYASITGSKSLCSGTHSSWSFHRTFGIAKDSRWISSESGGKTTDQLERERANSPASTRNELIIELHEIPIRGYR